MPPSASGQSSANGPVTSGASQISRACPIRAASRPAHSAPASPPTAEAESSTPIAAGERSSTRTQKTVCTAISTALNRLDAAVVAAITRSSGWPSTNRRPSATSARSERPGSGSGNRSSARIRESRAAEARKPNASATIASGAPSSWTSPPPRPGPAICAEDRTVSIAPFPATRRSRGSSTGRKDWWATSKKTVATPVTRATR